MLIADVPADEVTEMSTVPALGAGVVAVISTFESTLKKVEPKQF